jgi:alpha-beta hydrolase superfamily lysophospholipase
MNGTDLGRRPRVLVTTAGAAPVRAVVLVLAGGRAHSTAPARGWQSSSLRMIPFAWVARGVARGRSAAVWRLRDRVRGWNEPRRDPVMDAEWALAEVQRRHPGAQVIMIGHSMGGRTALRCAGDPSVIGVCALAPWIEPGEPVDQVAGRRLLIVHGDQDRITDPRNSARFAEQAAAVGATVRYQSMPGDMHAMLARASHWIAHVRDFVASLLGATAPKG